MDCRQTREKLLDYREGLLDLGQQMHVEAHLLVCPPCGEEVLALETVFRAVKTLPVPEPSSGFGLRLRARLAREKRAPAPRWLWRPRLWPAWAAGGFAAALVAGAGLWAALLAPMTASTVDLAAAPGSAATARAHPFPAAAPGVGPGIWGSQYPDLTTLGEAGDRGVAALVLGGEDVNFEEIVRAWRTTQVERKGIDVLLGMIEFSDQELEELVSRLGKG